MSRDPYPENIECLYTKIYCFFTEGTVPKKRKFLFPINFDIENFVEQRNLNLEIFKYIFYLSSL
jgi:hypothetical protein